MKNFIQSIGIEVECGINREEYYELEKFAEGNSHISLGSDASVCVEGYDYRNVEVRYWDTSLKKVKEFVKYLWKEGKIKQNETCGNHIHLRLTDNTLLTGIFSYRTFWDAFKRQYKKTFGTKKYLSRFYNRYCIARYNPDCVIKQLRGDWGARYRAINLTALRAHNTIEIRLMPYAESMMEHLQQIDWVYNTVNKILNKFIKKNIYSQQIRVYAEKSLERIEIQRDKIIERVDINKEVLKCA